MKKVVVPVSVFIAGVSVGVWMMLGGGLMGNSDVYSNSDTVCKVENLGATSVSGCTGGSWSTWDLAAHTQIYNGFIYTTHTTRTWYSRPHKTCGYLKSDKNTYSVEACTMTKTDDGAPIAGATTENVPATCENCDE